MFLVSDKLDERRRMIRRFHGRETTIGAILASVDFEWTVRRAILALGIETPKVIRETVLRSCYGPDAYKDAWKAQVLPLHHVALPSVVPDWSFLKKDAFVFRNRLVHGAIGNASESFASDRRDCMLAASAAIANFASEHGVDLFRRLPVRRKAREILS